LPRALTHLEFCVDGFHLAFGPSAAICWPETVQAELNHIIHQQTKRKSQLKGKCLIATNRTEGHTGKKVWKIELKIVRGTHFRGKATQIDRCQSTGRPLELPARCHFSISPSSISNPPPGDPPDDEDKVMLEHPADCRLPLCT